MTNDFIFEGIPYARSYIRKSKKDFHTYNHYLEEFLYIGTDYPKFYESHDGYKFVDVEDNIKGNLRREQDRNNIIIQNEQ